MCVNRISLITQTMYLFWVFFLFHITVDETTASTPTTTRSQDGNLTEILPLQMAAIPADINTMKTVPLTINCTYRPPPNQQVYASLQSICLTRSNGRVLSVLSTSNPDSPTTTDDSVFGTGVVKVKGQIYSTVSQVSYLSLTFETPTEEDKGYYYCDAYLKDGAFSTMRISRNIFIRDATNAYIKNRMVYFNKELFQQKETTSDFQQKIDSREKKLEDQISVCFKTLDSVEEELLYQNQTTSSYFANIESLHKEVKNTKNTMVAFQENAKSLEKNISNNLLENEKKFESLEREQEKQKSTSFVYQKDIKTLKNKLDSQKDSVLLCRDKTKSLEKDLLRQKSEIANQKNSISSYQKKITSLQTELDHHKLESSKKISSFETELDNQVKAISAIGQHLAKNERTMHLIRFSGDFHISPVFKNKVYALSKNIIESFSKADEVCKSMEGYLVEINDAEDWSFITGFIKDKKLLSVVTGGKDDIKEGSWYWSNSKLPVTFTKWRDGEPNNAGGNEDCLEIEQGNLQWNDISCSFQKRYNFICELPLNIIT